MSTRTLLALFSTLLIVSLGVGLAGMAHNHPGVMHSGILASISSGTALVCTTLLHATRRNETERAADHLSGYHLGLHHAALGLLDTPPSGGTVVPLRPDLPRQHERQAQ